MEIPSNQIYNSNGKNDVWHNANAYVLGRSGTVIGCVRERNNSMYCAVVYTLLGGFKAYDPNVVVKVTSNSFYMCGDEVQHIRDHIR